MFDLSSTMFLRKFTKHKHIAPPPTHTYHTQPDR